MAENKECPICKEKKMYFNQAGGLTCGNKSCGMVIMPCSAEKHRELLCMITEANDLLKKVV